MKSRKACPDFSGSEDRRQKIEVTNSLPSVDGLKWASLIWIITIAILSGYPGNKIPKSPFLNFDKLVHLGTYFVLSFILCYWFHKKNAKSSIPIKIAVIIILFGIFYGGFMEMLQEYIFINRSGNWYDFFANAIGAILGAVLFPFVLKLLPFKR